MSSAAYESEAEGLQVVERNDYPEVSAAYRSEAGSLQVMEPSDYPFQGTEKLSGLPNSRGADFKHAHTRHQADLWAENQEAKALIGDNRRRKCGLKKSHAWLVGGLLALLVVRAVLGVTFSTLLQESKDGTTSKAPSVLALI